MAEPSVAPPPAEGLRDRKRRDTRAALALAALELFEEQGVAATTVDDIAARADVARRTFFRYFPTKESVLLPSTGEYHDVLNRLLAAQPKPLTAEAVLDTFIEAASRSLGEDAEELRRRRSHIIATNDVQVASAVQDGFIAARDEATARLAAITGLPADDRSLFVVVNFALFVVSLAYQTWAQGEGEADLATECRSMAQLLRKQFTTDLPIGS